MKRILLAALLIVALAAPGCARVRNPDEPRPGTPETEAVEPTPTPAPAEPAQEKTTVLVYLLRGEKLGVGGREVPATDDTEKLAAAALEALVEGPTPTEREFGLGTTIPDGTTVNGVRIEGRKATVDLSARYQSGGGSLSMLLRAAQVIYTVTQFEGVTQVAFKIDGKPLEALGGEGVIVSPSVTRKDFEGQAPAILIERPYAGETVKSPLRISGSANTFEAMFRVNITDPEGLIVVDEPVQATSGTGTRGTFSESYEFEIPRDGLGEVIVFELSAKDGKRINLVEVPVQMSR